MRLFFEEGTGRFRALWRRILQFEAYQVVGLLFVVLLRVALSPLNPQRPGRLGLLRISLP